MMIEQTKRLPVAVIGAGPIGLVAAAHLEDRGLDFVVIEKGPRVGHHIEQWGHVRMFSPWKYNIDSLARRLLGTGDWVAPKPDNYPTGSELIEGLLGPLASRPELSRRLRLNTEVLSVTRRGADRLKSSDRDSRPYRLRLRTRAGGEEDLEVRAVIDASGTWSQPNPLGAGGVPAVGEVEGDPLVQFGIPNLAEPSTREKFDGRTVAVVGGGDSAFNTLVDLSIVARQNPATRIHWVLRGAAPTFRRGVADQLPEREALANSVAELLRSDQLFLHESFQIARVDRRGEMLELSSDDGRGLQVHQVVAVTGFRPNLEMLRELRLDFDTITEAPLALGPLIDPNVHSCGTVPPHGFQELSHPESGFFVAGIKSYGRAPTFLLLTGFEQVRSIVAYLAGDLTAARQVTLVLPETGVCGGDISPAVPARPVVACCGAARG